MMSTIQHTDRRSAMAPRRSRFMIAVDRTALRRCSAECSMGTYCGVMRPGVILASEFRVPDGYGRSHRVSQEM